MWKGEIRPFSDTLIRELLKTDGIEIRSFAKTTEEFPVPVWTEEIRDIIGGLQLDGMSFREAQDELLRAGETFEIYRDKLPLHFYRPVDWYYDQFCEEPEHDMWMREKDINKIPVSSKPMSISLLKDRHEKLRRNLA